MSKPLRRQLVIVGDGACGKTCLLIVYSQNRFPEEHIPTVFESYVKPIRVDGREVHLSLWDTAGQETFDRLRTLAYPDSDVILIAFSIGDPETLGNIPEKWLPEVQYHCGPKMPFFLVGCKKDLRNDSKTLQQLQSRGMTTVSYAQGRAMADAIRARAYVECSAKLNDNVPEVFDLAVKATMPKRIRSFCVLL
ncbi:Rho1 GTPase [Dichotomocladium elegans]|nr:Rho1 GTPase [Dichotomocladium elegans]